MHFLKQRCTCNHHGRSVIEIYDNHCDSQNQQILIVYVLTIKTMSLCVSILNQFKENQIFILNGYHILLKNVELQITVKRSIVTSSCMFNSVICTLFFCD